MENKTIKIFISSSCELSAEREALAGFATEVNNIWCDKGITVIPVEWEFVESGLNGGSKQDEYNQAIDECVRCVVMFDTKVGKYTKEELDYALQRAKEGKNPKRVDVLFKYSDVKELEKYPDVKGVYDDLMAKEMFPEKFNNFTFSNFNTMDALKLKFLTYIQFELKQYFADIDLKIEDGKVTMGGKTFFEYSNLPSFKNCEEYQNLFQLRQRLNRFFSDNKRQGMVVVIVLLVLFFIGFIAFWYMKGNSVKQIRTYDFVTKTYRIKVRETMDGSFVYSSWKVDAGGSPDIVIRNGYYDSLRHCYVFQNGTYYYYVGDKKCNNCSGKCMADSLIVKKQNEVLYKGFLSVYVE
ncbi:MAG: DUF4062 domain-containing protein [archaeon]|nr:DUF4062 domain-containing protein [archaeon]